MIGVITWIVIMPAGCPKVRMVTRYSLYGQKSSELRGWPDFFPVLRSIPIIHSCPRWSGSRMTAGKRVVSTGVYGVCQASMYLGGVFMFIGAPLLLGSGYGLFTGITLTAFPSFYGNGDTGGRKRCLPGTGGVPVSICKRPLPADSTYLVAGMLSYVSPEDANPHDFHPPEPNEPYLCVR